MRLGKLVLAGLATAVLAGCGGGGTPNGAATSEPAGAGDPWVLVEPGKAVASKNGSGGGAPRSALPPVSYLPTTPACATAWPRDDMVLIPMTVTPIAGGFKVAWPASYGPTYRVTAVHQDLVTGAQPEPTWQTVQAAGCTASATITGLIPGDPYIVWLDAPQTPRRADGSRSLYSGKSAVVHPL
jgi:hypothetical protein